MPSTIQSGSSRSRFNPDAGERDVAITSGETLCWAGPERFVMTLEGHRQCQSCVAAICSKNVAAIRTRHPSAPDVNMQTADFMPIETINISDEQVTKILGTTEGHFYDVKAIEIASGKLT